MSDGSTGPTRLQEAEASPQSQQITEGANPASGAESHADQLAETIHPEEHLRTLLETESQDGTNGTIPPNLWGEIAPQQPTTGGSDELEDMQPVTPQKFLEELNNLLNNSDLNEEDKQRIYQAYVEVINRFKDTTEGIEQGTRPKALTMGLKKSLLKIISTFALTQWLGIASSPAGGLLLAISTALTTINTLRGTVDDDTKREKQKDQHRNNLEEKYKGKIEQIEKQLAQILQSESPDENQLKELTRQIEQLTQSWKDARDQLQRVA